MSVYTKELILSFIPFYNNIVPEIQKFNIKYKLIQNNDFKKPIYCQTDKYNSFNINKKKKFKSWEKSNAITNDIKIKQFVIENFNKLSNKNFDSIYEILIKELKKIKYSDVLDILSEEILKKIIFDKSYYNIYSKLCYELINNKLWQNNFYKIYFDNKKYFYLENRLSLTNNNKRLFFNTRKEAKLSGDRCLCFHNKFIMMMKNEFHKQNEYIKQYEKEEHFKLKRKIFANGEFLAHLFNINCISKTIIISYLNSLITVPLHKIKLELFYNMWNIINDVPDKEKYLEKIDNNILKSKLPMRIKFMFIEIQENELDKQ